MNEEYALRQAHPLYDSWCNDDVPAYDPGGGFYDYEQDKWESYDDM